jgi:polyisoprenoid-binding protein YceI
MRILLLSLGLMIACGTDPGKDKVAATVQDVPEAAPKADSPSDAAAQADAPKAASGDALAVDPTKSKLSCVGAKITEKHPIVFHKYTGIITTDNGQVTGIEYTADMAGLEADHPKLTEHLLNEDFFWIEKYPTSTFRSTEISEGSDTEGMTHTVTGDLTIRGKTKRVTFPAKLTVGDAEVSATTEFVINRQDFDVTYPGRPDDLIQDNVLLQVNFVAPRS